MQPNIPAPKNAFFNTIKRPARLVGVGILALVLLIPLGMVSSVISERHARYRGVVDEIARSWSGQQQLTGPILLIPFTEHFKVVEEYVTAHGEKKTQERWESRSRRAVLLPQNLNIKGEMRPEIRKRGIYNVQVYANDLTLSGDFSDLNETISTFFGDSKRYDIHWQQTALSVGLSEPKGIVGIENLSAMDHSYGFLPGTLLTDTLARGFHASLNQGFEGQDFDFNISFTARGSQGFVFHPIGGRTRAKISSTWPHPSFFGEILPADRDISEQGFHASWDISLLNRSYPQQWLEGEAFQVNEIEAGVRLFEPVALYGKVTRSVKYGLLFIALTFLTLGLIEFVTGERISLVQYLLIGAALAIFFLILIALAEHIGFETAYAVASAVVIALNTLYCSALLQTKKLALLVGSVLTGTYTVLYTILVAEDFALLGGTLVLVIALATTMFFTRKFHRV